MSDIIKHECGIALIRLLKPLEYYEARYGDFMYGLNKLYLLMEKQRNRGQEGAGVACIKFDVEPGYPYIERECSNSRQPIQDIFDKIKKGYTEAAVDGHFKQQPKVLIDASLAKKNIPFCAELLLGHLRYGTYGESSIECCHPFIRESNWKTRNLVIAGNFNLTNTDELFEFLVNRGMSPKEKKDTVTILEKIGNFLDEEDERLFKELKEQGYTDKEISCLIEKELDIKKILTQSAKDWDGGYVIVGLIGHGDAFILRDPAGIRPAYYYYDDEIVVAASERPAIQTTFNVKIETINELKPGHVLIIKKDGEISEELYKEPTEKKACSFERIYFSRGTDPDIYNERKALGKYLCPAVLKSISYDLENTVFSYIPNTAEAAFFGLKEGITDYLVEYKKKKIKDLGNSFSDEELEKILNIRIRIEKTAIKDERLRTFIAQDKERKDLVSHIYDITYGVVREGIDTLVVIDDSIVRGTTLQQSILQILDRINPKKIIIVSSAPQIRYPDCYGIDMSVLGDFIAFQAAIALLNETKEGKEIINKVYKKCKEHLTTKEPAINYVKEIYAPFTDEQIAKKVGELVKPQGMNAELEIIYQTIEALHRAIPNHHGDWYFTGDYPTPGGNKVVNRAFINFCEGIKKRPY